MNNQYFKRNRTHLLCILQLLTIFVLSSCGSTEKKLVVTSFPIDETLQPARIASLDSLPFIYSVAKIDDKYVFTCKGDYCFYVTDSQFNPLYPMAARGNGHEEWIAPLLMRQTVNENSVGLTYLWERGTSDLYKTELANSGKRIHCGDFRDTGLKGVSYLFDLKDGKYAGATYEEDCQFFIYNKKDNQIEYMAHPEILVPEAKDIRPSVLQTRSMMDNDMQRGFACSYFAYPVIVLRDMSGDIRRFIQIGEELPDYNTNKETEDFFVDVCVTSNRIYALHEGAEDSDESLIMVFDWDGNPIAKYHIGRSYAITVDEDEHLMIAVHDSSSEGNEVVKYNLKLVG